MTRSCRIVATHSGMRRRRAKASTRWRYAEIDTNHMIPQNRPHELATLLLRLSEAEPTGAVEARAARRAKQATS